MLVVCAYHCMLIQTFISQYFLLNHLNCLGQFVSLPLAQDGNICFNQHIPDSTYVTIKIKVSSGDVSLAAPDLNLIPCEREFVTLPLDQTKQLKILVSLATNTKPSSVRPIAIKIAIIKSRAL